MLKLGTIKPIIKIGVKLQKPALITMIPRVLPPFLISKIYDMIILKRVRATESSYHPAGSLLSSPPVAWLGDHNVKHPVFYKYVFALTLVLDPVL